MKRLIIPFFIRNRGCAHRCVFCNERIIADNAGAVTEDALRETAGLYLAGGSRKYNRVEIAFYGGSFTGMAAEGQLELLRMAGRLIGEGVAHSIRLSTRPDEIEGRWLDTLWNMGVRAIEIGAQSMDDKVLQMSGRGHTADHVRQAVAVLKGKGFETGIHLMAGLPGDQMDTFAASVSDVIACKPDTVRIHPVLVFRNTELANLYERGEYVPLTIDEAVRWCKVAVVRLARAEIPVIRLGLHATGEMAKKGNVLAGPYDPAFRSLVDASIFRDMALELLDEAGGSGGVFHVAPADLSNFNGVGRGNRAYLEVRYGSGSVKVKKDPMLRRGSLKLQDGHRQYETSMAEVRIV